MAVHKILLEDFIEDEQFSLIGIHCTINDYRLAYLLNSCLDLNLKRTAQDLDNNSAATYSIYEWEDNQQQVQWNLVSNMCKIEIEEKHQTLNTLFENKQNGSQTHHLVPEHKKSNYLVKICNKFNPSKEKQILNKILTIPQVITAYSINANALKSKDNLIFN